jgi:hypothetical protein
MLALLTDVVLDLIGVTGRQEARRDVPSFDVR